MRRSSGGEAYFRNFVFGVEDGLVSTVAFLAGVSITSIETKTLFVSGVVLIFVEAFSMAAGSFLSEESTEEYEQRSIKRSLVPYGGALIMFVSYFAAGLIPLLPYVLFPRSFALGVSIACTLLALFVLGLVSGRLSGIRVARSGIRAILVGGMAIALGIFVGSYADANLL